MESNTNIQTLLTTVDNPFDPFTQFNEWYVYDCDKGYNTCALLDRVMSTFGETDANDEESFELLRMFSIKRIVSLLPNLYKMVNKEIFVESLPITDQK